MPRDFRLYLDDILDAIHQIRTYMTDCDEDAFSSDRKTQDAVIRNLEIIGEAAGNLPEQFLESAPEIEWRKIKGLRNILAHEYFGINIPIILDVVQNKLGPLEENTIKAIEYLSSSIINKLIHPPTAALKSVEEDRELMIDMANRLFKLETEENNGKKK